MEQPDYLKDNIKAIALIRELVIESFKRLEGICTIAPANGAFYFFFKVHTQMDAFELVKQLISKYQVAVLPGTTFGMDRGCYLRVAYGALQKATAKQGIARLVNGLNDIAHGVRN